MAASSEAESRSTVRVSLIFLLYIFFKASSFRIAGRSRCLFKPPWEGSNGVADTGGTLSIPDQRDLAPGEVDTQQGDKLEESDLPGTDTEFPPPAAGPRHRLPPAAASRVPGARAVIGPGGEDGSTAWFLYASIALHR